MLVYHLGNGVLVNVLFCLCCRPVTRRGRTLLPKEPSYNHNSGKDWKHTLLLRSVKVLLNPGHSSSSRASRESAGLLKDLEDLSSSGQLLLDQRAESEDHSGMAGDSLLGLHEGLLYCCNTPGIYNL